MNSKLILQIVFLFIGVHCFGQRQTVLTKKKQVSIYNTIPQEFIYLKSNSNYFFPGEYLLYNLYNLTEKNKISNLSQIAYVALINSTNEVIFKHRLYLEKGQGQGEYFIPTNIPSGKYKLIGFTQWMLNRSEHDFYEKDIDILNPYQSKNDHLILSMDSISTKLSSKKRVKEKYVKGLKIKTNKEKYSKQEEIIINFLSKNNSKYTGVYSLSVRKIEDYEWSNKFDHLVTYTKQLKETNLKSIGDSVYLPELKGALFYGKILPKLKADSLSIKDIKISISINGAKDYIKIVQTDPKGNFIFNLNKNFTNKKLIIRTLKEYDYKYDIKIDNYPELPLVKFSDSSLKIAAQYKDDIINRSIYNQIENNYYNVKPDTIKVSKKYVNPFYGTTFTSYNLDDYTRFPSVKETIVEIILGVSIVKNKEKKLVFNVKKSISDKGTNLLEPLVIVDGIHITNHEDIISYNPNNIKTIHFVSERYYLGETIYDGVLSVETFDRLFLKNFIQDNIKFESINTFQPTKNYFKQDYSKNIKYNIPDFRSQLLWEPNADIYKEFSFYASDNTGAFLISLEGITNKGIPIHIEKTIRVE